MTKGPELSEDFKKEIIQLHQSGNGYKKISQLPKFNVRTIGSIVRKWKKNGIVKNLPVSRTCVARVLQKKVFVRKKLKRNQ